MPARSRTKGMCGEREAITLLAEHGIEAERIYGQEAKGGAHGDLDTDVGYIEVKRRASVPAWLQPAPDVRMVLVRQDRGAWLVILRATDGLRMMASERAKEKAEWEP